MPAAMLPSFSRSFPLPLHRPRVVVRGMAMPRGAVAFPWHPALFVTGFGLLNLALLAHPGVRYLMILPHDWSAWTELPVRVAAGTVYEPHYSFVWSPIAAWLLAYVFVPLGYSWWLGLHLASLVLLRNWKLAVLAVLSVPFWVDTIGGNTFVFFFVAGAAAYRGSRVGALAYLALCCLAPRPIQAPLAAWLLWHRPENRVPFAIMVSITIGAGLWSGLLDDWINSLMFLGLTNSAHFANLAPTKLSGSAWLAVGIPIGIWLTLRGRVGLAGLMVGPYALPGYLLVLLWDHWNGSVTITRQGQP
ncbi:MAG TPA: hypothetical protein VLA89_14255 [Gemmatimonadales bacterium]|nr:hypothetical protein [Gemmatimonadales bacterium]